MTGRRQLFWAACAGIFVFGIVLAVLGVIFGLDEMRTRLDVDDARQGNVFLALFFGVLLSTIIAGPMIDSFGNKIVLVVSALLVTVSLVLLALAASYPAALIAGLLMGFGGGGLNTSTNALVSDVYAENRGPMLNVLGTFFGVGALVVPLSSAAIMGVFSVSQLLLTIATLAGILTLTYMVMSFPPPREAIGFSLLASVKAASYPGVLLFAAILFCQSGNESSIGGWTSRYTQESLGASQRTGTLILAGYWAALMFGRLAGAQILQWISKPRLVLASAIGSIMGCAVLLASNSIALVTLGAIIVGLSFAAIYPTVLAIAADRYERMAGTIFGFLFSVGLIGGMLFPWGVGHISQAQSLRMGMIVPLIGSIAITMLALMMLRGVKAR
jgi:MFS transporter, FHS family, glucose/mannose:H+ symporter